MGKIIPVNFQDVQECYTPCLYTKRSNWTGPAFSNCAVSMAPGGVVALLEDHRTCDSQVAGLSPAWAPLHSGLS